MRTQMRMYYVTKCCKCKKLAKRIQSLEEEAEFVIMDLIAASQNQKVIADVNIPIHILKKIAEQCNNCITL